MTDLFDNPMGLMGFEFVEFAAPKANILEPVFEQLGFTKVATHRSKDVSLYRQGDINFIINNEPNSAAAYFAAEHGPSACGMAFRVKDAPKAYARALSLGAQPMELPTGPMELRLPAIKGIGGAPLYLIDRFEEGSSIYDIDFNFIEGVDRHPVGHGLRLIDHLTHNVYRGRMNHWALFYERIFNFREIRYFDIKGEYTGLTSRAMTAPDVIRSGEARAVISAGVESLSFGTGRLVEDDARDPQFQPAWERTARRASREIPPPWHDPREDDELPDPYILMGQTAENVAELRGISRQAQDEYGVRSQQRAEAAIASGFFDRDITPVTLADGTVVSADDSPRAGTTLEKVSTLDPVFRPEGTVTAGNCCPLSDGAAALMVMEAGYARELGITPLARIVSTGVSGLSPEIMGLGPVESTRRALTNAGLGIDDMDLVELNEAFAAQVIPSAEDLGIDHDTLNVHGGAIALGHPWGSTGARMTTTLINGLRERDGQFGLATLCVGGGQGMALIIERMS